MFEPQVPEYRPPSHLTCKWCDKPIFVGDRSVLIHHGMLGRGKKSGQPVVVDGEMTSNENVVHELCSIPFLLMNVVDSSEEGMEAIDTITGDLFGTPYSELADRKELCAACEGSIE